MYVQMSGPVDLLPASESHQIIFQPISFFTRTPISLLRPSRQTRRIDFARHIHAAMSPKWLAIGILFGAAAFPILVRPRRQNAEHALDLPGL